MEEEAVAPQISQTEIIFGLNFFTSGFKISKFETRLLQFTESNELQNLLSVNSTVSEVWLFESDR